LHRWHIHQFGVEPTGPHQQGELLTSRPWEQLLHASQKRMNRVTRGTVGIRVWRQSRKSGAGFFERVAAPPQQLGLESFLAQVVELVEVDLEHALIPAKLTPERAQMVVTARHQGKNHRPASSLVWSNSTARSTSPTSSAPRA